MKPGGTIELPGIEDVVPDAVEAADEGGFGSHEGVCHPDGEDCVLLTEGLTGSDFSDISAQCELQDAAHQRNKGHKTYHAQRQRTCHKVFHRDRDGKGEGDRPDIEGQVRIFKKAPVQLRKEIAYQPGCQTRKDQ